MVLPVALLHAAKLRKFTNANVPLRWPSCLPACLQVLVRRFEGLLDRILRQETLMAQGGLGTSLASASISGAPPDRVAAAAAKVLTDGAGSDLPLSSRSLAASFWALGNMRYPLTQEQLDKVAGAQGAVPRGCLVS